ncbi:MAG: Nif3-like dinuclear metal center hexameric protein, partial [Elusimicrobiales bacterium]|nr:Nif3-like dinuclear metal center hexameric protein [Elusimicrobiales bacterium]
GIHPHVDDIPALVVYQRMRHHPLRHTALLRLEGSGKDILRVAVRRIRAREVMVVDETGAKLGVMPTDVAMHRAEEAGLDLFVTGEAGEPSQETARELGINFISAGHYNTEKDGVRNLGRLLARRFRVAASFIDVPNPV